MWIKHVCLRCDYTKNIAPAEWWWKEKAVWKWLQLYNRYYVDQAVRFSNQLVKFCGHQHVEKLQRFWYGSLLLGWPALLVPLYSFSGESFMAMTCWRAAHCSLYVCVCACMWVVEGIKRAPVHTQLWVNTHAWNIHTHRVSFTCLY